MSTLNEEYLLDFQSILNLSSKDCQLLSRAAFLAFFCAEDFCIRSSTIKRYITKYVTRDSKGNRQENLVKDFGKFDIKEFLKLPEISCLIYQFKLQDSKCCYKYYQSVFNSIKNGERCMIYWFRKSIITCIQKAVDQKLGDNYGNITLNILCDTFNDTFGYVYGWHCNLEEKITFLGDKTFFYSLCFYCSKEIVINFHQNSTPKFRLRNHPNFLFKEIENEQILAAKTIKVYNQYYKNNPDQILWFTLIPDLNFTDIPSNLSEYVSYPPTLIANIYAAFHRSSAAITDFQRLIKVIKKMDNYKKASDISNLVEMLSPKSLMAIECWDLKEQLLFANITDDYILTLNQTKQNSLFQQLEKIWMSEFNEYPLLSADVDRNKLIMGVLLSKIYSNESDYFIDKNPCSCSSKYWKSEKMDLNIAIILEEKSDPSKKNVVEKSEIDVINIQLKCVNCDSSFRMALYYFNGECHRQYGYFRQYITRRDPIPLNLPHDSLKLILNEFSKSKNSFTSIDFAIDLFNLLSKEDEIFVF